MKTKKFGVGDKVKILHCSDMMLIGQLQKWQVYAERKVTAIII